MEKNEIYEQLVKIAEEKSLLLEKVEFDPELARENARYVELEKEERGLLERIKKAEYEEIINNSFLFAYDQALAAKRASSETEN